MSKHYEQLGRRIGALVDTKNVAYGSSFAKAGEFLRLLYPDGVRQEQMTDALLVVRIFDKLVRIATDRDALGESPYADIAGYGLLGARMHDERLDRKGGEGKECGSVKGEGVGEESKATEGSATPGARPTTTRSASESNAPLHAPTWNEHSASTSASTAAPAPTAKEAAFQREAASLAQAAHQRNLGNVCGAESCGRLLRSGHSLKLPQLGFCSPCCVDVYYRTLVSLS